MLKIGDRIRAKSKSYYSYSWNQFLSAVPNAIGVITGIVREETAKGRDRIYHVTGLHSGSGVWYFLEKDLELLEEVKLSDDKLEIIC